MKNLLLLVFALLCINASKAQSKKVTLSGYISEAKGNEKLIGASVYIDELKAGATTNSYGFYTITVPAGKYNVQYSYVGYQALSATLDLTKSLSKDVTLNNSKNITEIKITSKRKQAIQQTTQTSMNSIPMNQIKSLPAIFGEVDVLKALQLLPGVSGGSEGSSGIYVRGGGPDQNLFLLDGVPVYNVSHLGGFFSTFNADAISNVDLYKGGFPARFGGRLSSVVDIRMKEGNNKKIHGEAAIGAISSRLVLEGPIVKNKGSFMISGRRTYIDQIISPIVKAQTNGQASFGYYFYDLNAKANYKLSEKDHVYLSGYFGQDVFSVGNSTTTTANETNKVKFGLNWGNTTAVARWNHLFNSQLFGNLSTSYSKYAFNLGVNQESTVAGVKSANGINFLSGIKDYAAKYDLEYTPNIRHNIKGGIGFTNHKFTPNTSSFSIQQGNLDSTLSLSDQVIYSNEYDAYLEDDWKVSDKLRANIGAHFSGFDVQNKLYTNIQPRVSARYLLNQDYSIKASYVQMNQFINLISFGGVGLPSDYWVPVTAKIKPQVSHQFALGAAGTVAKGYELSVEGYYKTMQNIIDYKDGAQYLGSSSYEDIVEMGRGKCYGAEVFLQKKEGQLQGMIGYTLSWAERQFPTINGGKWFYYKYDRRHDFKIAAIYKLKNNWEISGDWVYNTGTWLTIQTQTINPNIPDVFNLIQNQNQNNTAGYYPSKNNYNMKDYHRMDIGLRNTKQKKYFERTWAIGCYNLYGRKNTFFIFNDTDVNGKKIFQSFALFGFPIPYLSLSFKW
jgi:TonB dependent receptor/CarboxypepD_reg-like domain/TonB-dependent Receptor Plug Domain